MGIKHTQESILKKLDERNEKYPPVYPVELFRYENIHQRLEWRCENGHIWVAPIVRILQGKGCPTCSARQVGVINQISIDDLVRRLDERNKQFPNKKVYIVDLSNYSGITKQCMWRCEHNHTWTALPKTILKGSYCPECKRLGNIKRHSYTHEDFQQVLNERNQTNTNKKVFIHQSSAPYTGSKNNMTFTCEQGHTWNSCSDNMINRNAGCPICARASYSHAALEWICAIERTQRVRIQHACSDGGEYRIPGTNYRVDGFCHETNTVYEFYGDFWHGNPRVFNPTDLNTISKKTFGELLAETIQRENAIKSMGYNIVTIWEYDWNQLECESEI